MKVKKVLKLLKMLAGIKSLKLNFYKNFKILLAKLVDFLYKASPKSLLIEGIRSSKQKILSSAGWTGRLDYLATFDVQKLISPHLAVYNISMDLNDFTSPQLEQIEIRLKKRLDISWV